MRLTHQTILLEFICCQYVDTPTAFTTIEVWFRKKIKQEKKLQKNQQVTLKASDLPDEVVLIIVHYLIVVMNQFYL